MALLKHHSIIFITALCLGLVAGCSSVPDDPNNLCSIFDENDDWFEDAVAAEQKWNASIPVMMSIMYHESGYRDNAKPGYRWALGIIPLGRKSSAYGYAQALDGTWRRYIRKTGNRGADRDDFDDAIDFIGWYLQENRTQLGLKKTDAYSHYLAYHEGQGGFRRKSYRQKPWLLKVAQRVAARAQRYEQQLKTCRADLE